MVKIVSFLLFLLNDFIIIFFSAYTSIRKTFTEKQKTDCHYIT